MALRIRRVSPIGRQLPVYLSPQNLRRRPTSEDTLQPHLLAQQEHPILLGTPEFDGRLVRRAHFFDLEHRQLALVEQQESPTVRIARIGAFIFLVFVLHVQNVKLAVVILSDSRRDSYGSELISIVVAYDRPVDVRIGHACWRGAVQDNPVAATSAYDFGARAVRKLRQLGHSEAGSEAHGRPVLVGGVALVPALVGGGRVRDDEGARVALHGDAVVLGARVVDALVFGPGVAGRRVAFGHAGHFDVDARVEDDLFVGLADD